MPSSNENEPLESTPATEETSPEPQAPAEKPEIEDDQQKPVGEAVIVDMTEPTEIFPAAEEQA